MITAVHFSSATDADRDGSGRFIVQGTELDRFMSKVCPEPNTGCWLWLGAVNAEGYGKFQTGRSKAQQHHIAHRWIVGAGPYAVVMHLCEQPSCVNPAHLRIATQWDNRQDSVRKGRVPRGPEHWNWKHGRCERAPLSRVLFSSISQEWATPAATFERLAKMYGPFDRDLAATPGNAKCPSFFTREQDALARPWEGVCFLNPPYSREMGPWLEKAARETSLGRAQRVVCLLPARVDTAWFHDWVQPFARFWFIRGRLKFVGADHGAPFPSMVAVFPKRARPTALVTLPLFAGGSL